MVATVQPATNEIEINWVDERLGCWKRGIFFNIKYYYVSEILEYPSINQAIYSELRKNKASNASIKILFRSGKGDSFIY